MSPSGGRSTSTPPSAPDGWVAELEEAARNAKQDKASAGKQLRVARAACKLRLWSKCLKAAQKGLRLNPNDDEKQQLTICKGIAEKAEKERASSVASRADWIEFREHFARGERNMDITNSKIGGCSYENVNVLQAAAWSGDVPALEDLVALGAALDYPVRNDPTKTGRRDALMAPPGFTALVLVCANLAVHYGNNLMASAITGSAPTPGWTT